MSTLRPPQTISFKYWTYFDIASCWVWDFPHNQVTSVSTTQWRLLLFFSVCIASIFIISITCKETWMFTHLHFIIWFSHFYMQFMKSYVWTGHTELAIFRQYHQQQVFGIFITCWLQLHGVTQANHESLKFKLNMKIFRLRNPSIKHFKFKWEITNVRNQTNPSVWDRKLLCRAS